MRITERSRGGTLMRWVSAGLGTKVSGLTPAFSTAPLPSSLAQLDPWACACSEVVW